MVILVAISSVTLLNAGPMISGARTFSARCFATTFGSVESSQASTARRRRWVVPLTGRPTAVCSSSLSASFTPSHGGLPLWTSVPDKGPMNPSTTVWSSASASAGTTSVHSGVVSCTQIRPGRRQIAGSPPKRALHSALVVQSPSTHTFSEQTASANSGPLAAQSAVVSHWATSVSTTRLHELAPEPRARAAIAASTAKGPWNRLVRRIPRRTNRSTSPRQA